MAREIERKLLVDELPDDLDGPAWSARRLEQGYLAITDAAEVRIRRADGREAWLTVKSAPSFSRVEEELPLDGRGLRAALAADRGPAPGQGPSHARGRAGRGLRPRRL